ncbi:cytochrome oxidase complex assembly protein 1-domain-containing protein [Mycotypha africana]|uniref:cytochrome oxidase complex assembly protein 1-domain-containing protein n=1 Tax=Mycotypha africana TaxID=64632 RepID=UPI0023011C87|nr:cytochrome oxidase complex assembly protein 1-domain-containing protein [Mycotypha africana]KAI8975391.1 cytochrome oxidase complex assembly protein 1-domain-containing protein [Mycotypha africana]
MSFFSSRLLTVSRPLAQPALHNARRQIASSIKSKTVVVERELPQVSSPLRKRWIWTGAGVGAVVWAVGLGAAMNHQRLSSSVVHGTLFMVRYDPRVIELLGDHVDYARSWPWISGSVNHLKGKIDIGFDVKGSSGETARVHFISRRTGHKWTTVEFTVARHSDNKSIDIGHQPLTETGEPSLLTTTD